MAERREYMAEDKNKIKIYGGGYGGEERVYGGGYGGG